MSLNAVTMQMEKAGWSHREYQHHYAARRLRMQRFQPSKGNTSLSPMKAWGHVLHLLQSHQPSLHPVLLVEHKLEIVIEWIHDMKSQTTNEWIHGMKSQTTRAACLWSKKLSTTITLLLWAFAIGQISQELYLEMGCCFFLCPAIILPS
jgi:hypothetical protein